MQLDTLQVRGRCLLFSLTCSFGFQFAVLRHGVSVAPTARGVSVVASRPGGSVAFGTVAASPLSVSVFRGTGKRREKGSVRSDWPFRSTETPSRVATTGRQSRNRNTGPTALPLQHAQHPLLHPVNMIQHPIHHQAQVLVLERLDAIHPADCSWLGELALHAWLVSNSESWLSSNHVNVRTQSRPTLENSLRPAGQSMPDRPWHPVKNLTIPSNKITTIVCNNVEAIALTDVP